MVKIGSSSLSAPRGGIDSEALQRVANNVLALWGAGHPTLLVTSGAVSAGLPALGLETRPTELAELQVAAAVGQVQLMAAYATAFGDRQVAQVLLTRDVLSRREQYLHARAALDRMLTLGVVPVVNENDTVVVDELRFGDNDRLAAILAHLVKSGMLILLTDTPGLFPSDPGLAGEGELLRAVEHTDQILNELRTDAQAGRFGSGGVATKVAAAQMAAWSGIPTVVAGAAEPDVAISAVKGEEVGTWIEPRSSRLGARKLWIAFGLPTDGIVEIDGGAVAALKEDGGSLLAVGVTGTRGEFPAGAAVEIHNDATLVAKGISQLSAEAIEISRRQQGEIVVHRDDLVVLQ